MADKPCKTGLYKMTGLVFCLVFFFQVEETEGRKTSWGPEAARILPASNLCFFRKNNGLEAFGHRRRRNKCPHYYEGTVFWSQPHTSLLRLCSALSTYLVTLQTARAIFKLPCSSSPSPIKWRISAWSRAMLVPRHLLKPVSGAASSRLVSLLLRSCWPRGTQRRLLAPHSWSHLRAPCPAQLTSKGQHCPVPNGCKKPKLLRSHLSGRREQRRTTQHDL